MLDDQCLERVERGCLRSLRGCRWECGGLPDSDRQHPESRYLQGHLRQRGVGRGRGRRGRRRGRGSGPQWHAERSQTQRSGPQRRSTGRYGWWCRWCSPLRR
ncbi:hypothetical protein ASQ49_04315 [Acidipropionibacterium acidipropionici]|nr:hypothetical protein ASQ49_04315 [Acidipropionibacterium acidipropionici]